LCPRRGCMTKILHPSFFTRALAATLLLALTGCGASNPTAADVHADASAHLPVDAIANAPSSDAALAKDTTPSTNRTPDATVPRTDLAIPDAVTGIKDSGREASPLADAKLVVDSSPTRADGATIGDASLRADTQTLDGLGGAPEAAVLACTIVNPTPPMGHLSPKELKAILDSSEDAFLINVKGTSIANIPGTDAVLASDVPGIEALVGGKLCANIILYCRSGATSQTVGKQLVAKGYQHVRDLSGGINAWTAAGYPTE
jgi:rhodanese-related sulfurtransferase